VLGERAIGRLEPGSHADLIVLKAGNLADAFGSGATAVEETWVGGTRVFSRDTPTSSGRG